MKKLTAVAFALIACAALAVAGDKDAKFGDVSHEELKKAMQEDKVTLIDVNGTESYKQGHIPGAINFEAAKNEFASKLPEEKDALIVAYCGNEKCTAYKQAAMKAKELGYTNVKHYSKGIAGWKAAGEKTES